MSEKIKIETVKDSRDWSSEDGKIKLIDRFMQKVVWNGDEDECWTWAAYVGNHGYGQFSFEGVPLLAHRWAYEYFVGPIPAGLHIDHLCRVRACVNPSHLEPVTNAENLRRGVGVGKALAEYQRSKTCCPQGHPYTPKNTYRAPTGGRACRECRDRHRREHLARNPDYLRDWKRRKRGETNG